MSQASGSNVTLPSSLPVKPDIASNSSSASSSSKPLISRISLPHGLPQKPTFALPTRPPSASLRSRPIQNDRPPRSRSPSPRRRSAHHDSYIPRSPPRRQDDWDRRDDHRPGPREDWGIKDTYIPRPLSPPGSRRRISVDRVSSRSPVKGLSSSSASAASPVPRAPSSELPKTFFTFSHKKSEEKHAREEQRRSEYEQRIREKRKRDDEAAEQDRMGRLADRSHPSEAVESAEIKDADDRSNLKRSASSTTIESGPSKASRPIPTGPKSATGVFGAPTGPRSRSGLRGIIASPTGVSSKTPTGPRAMTVRELHSTSSPSELALPSQPQTSPGPGTLQVLEGPIKDREAIMSANADLQLDQAQLQSPRSSLFDRMSHEGQTPQFSVLWGRIDGKRIARATVNIRGKCRIVCTGDGQDAKDAYEASALAAHYELTRREMSGATPPVAGSASPQDPVHIVEDSEAAESEFVTDSDVETSAIDTKRLSNGIVIQLPRAKKFMAYYCERYQFDPPSIEIVGSPPNCEAIMSVGGRTIGMGTGTSPEQAQQNSYLDVVQYLELCDPRLWTDFREEERRNALPSLVFQISEQLNEDIYGLCSDITQSKLHRKAPADGSLQPDAINQNPAQTSQNAIGDIQQISIEMKSKLDEYREDPTWEEMRTQRKGLPIYTKAKQIMDRISEDDVTVLVAATGSGKTTQIPQMILDDYIDRGQGAECNILCTQPRRLAARSVAERVAAERGQRLGKQVGYQVRFDAKLPQPRGSITYMTTGILHRRLQAMRDTNSDLEHTTHIIVDEAHERDIDTDLLLAVLKRFMAERKARGKPLKLILMSATIDPTLFQQYFATPEGPARVTEVPGRSFPVERHLLDEIVPRLKRYTEAQWVFRDPLVFEYLLRELSDDRALFVEDTEVPLPLPLVALTVAHILKQSTEGHILVFLPGLEEIKKTRMLLQTQHFVNGVNFEDPKYSIHFLHSAVPAEEQQKVFEPVPEGRRRIILATNIAETSVTIPDVVYVVDGGRLRENRYDPVSSLSSLVLAWVSKSHLDQRAGRAGRHRPGEYFSVISKLRLESLGSHQLVEMKRENLTNVVMHVNALNIGAVHDILGETIEPPAPDRVAAAIKSLQQLGVLDKNERLTSLGRVLQRLPIDAAVGKLLLYGAMFRCLDSALTLSAVMSLGSPFMVPLDRRSEVRKIHNSFSPSAFKSDLLAGLMAYNKWREIEERNWDEACEYCKSSSLKIGAMIDIRNMRDSLLRALSDSGILAVSDGRLLQRIHKYNGRPNVPPHLNIHNDSLPLLAALICLASAPNFAIQKSPSLYRTANDKHLIISNGSVNRKTRETGQSDKSPASPIVNEKRLYAFTVKASLPSEEGASGKSSANKKARSATSVLRQVSRIDPLTYLLFGAYDLVHDGKSLLCDSWLAVTGNPYTLSDIVKLRSLIDTCMLRVFEGLGHSLIMDRDSRRREIQQRIQLPRSTSPNISSDDEKDADVTQEDEAEEEQVRQILTLEPDEIRELQLLTADVVRILDAYAEEREGDKIYASSHEYGPELDDDLREQEAVMI
ncbi:P-loop containing nucleoside triphosphate hydrolase protein [Kockovaella imperatae]|uniref:p-loop containing nucleoside triphosphate hydrolase protein n=1 Tax=Kockovaella imperatae TaxID=4999 RepID=A0A1Y1UHA6_9TREE|nr:P-loop containing nucleoside triphosphate hydrolase protein [Kockovaella imperatae]ORX37412.1 P-loop containing nucleoside triphosphate hydrolase protein [Kockovaella imperatae]